MVGRNSTMQWGTLGTHLGTCAQHSSECRRVSLELDFSRGFSNKTGIYTLHYKLMCSSNSGATNHQRSAGIRGLKGIGEEPQRDSDGGQRSPFRLRVGPYGRGVPAGRSTCVRLASPRFGLRSPHTCSARALSPDGPKRSRLKDLEPNGAARGESLRFYTY
ncbi:hypothetical protein SKAU_G00117170 [Synaphobranchus kaupii]|uniref:Uncharacterized protein n=1 Tax=Synaphobranchus kaupii TaxID=118154 RepID=A0A9Q1J1N7_SYNKA|nr:hypothetical protein SKAU_G00117170 [Synaphobranchus kaupii]